MKASRIAVYIVVAVVTAGVAGCGDSSSPNGEASSALTSSSVAVATTSPVTTAPSATVTTTRPVTATTAPPVATGTGACKYVTTAQASAFATSAVKPGVSRNLTTGPVTFDYCDYIFDPGNAPGVTVAVASLGSDAATLFTQFRQSKVSESEYQAVSGVGDEAFFAGQNLNVRKGDKGLILYVGRSTGLPRGVDALPDEKRLAELIIGQL
jgi:hypothetical protein